MPDRLVGSDHRMRCFHRFGFPKICFLSSSSVGAQFSVTSFQKKKAAGIAKKVRRSEKYRADLMGRALTGNSFGRFAIEVAN